MTRPRRIRSWSASAVAAVLFVLTGAGPGAAQDADTLPKSQVLALPSIAEVPVRRFADVDTAALLAEDAAKIATPGPVRFAVPSSARVTPARAGRKDVLSDGGVVWRQRVFSAGATDLNFGFTRFRLPAGATLHIYSELYDYAVGPYTEADNNEHGQLWTAAVPGDRAVIELYLPAGATDDYELTLTSINRGYRDLLRANEEAAAKQGTCNVDVACSLGDGWRDQIRSVARYSISGTGLCTGTLIMDAASTFRSWFLTAAHCGVTSGTAPSVVVYWNFQSPTCGSLSGGSLAHSQSGATFRAGRADVDFTLVELSSQPAAAYNVFYAGWDRSGAAPPGSVGIHHPNGDEKAISYNDDALTTMNSCIGSGINTHWRVDNWEQGITEPGSSGSAIFHLTGKRVVGFLSGGTSSCANRAGYDCYGKMSVAWEGASSATRLRDWLDPNASGVTTVNGSNRTTTPGTVAAPSNLTATPASATQINLGWSDNSNNETGFRVRRKTGTAGTYGVIATPAAGATSFADTGRTTGTLYCYQVQAYNASGESAWSNEACATPTAACTPSAIALNQTINGSLSVTDCRSPIRGSAYFADRYTFSGSAGQQISVSLNSTAFDTYLILAAPTALPLAQDDDGGPDANSRIPADTGRITLPSAGTYTIEVTSYAGRATGSYSVTLSGGGNAPTSTTSPAQSVTTTSASLRGTVNPNGATTNAYFQWGLTTSYGNTTAAQAIGSGTSAVSVSAALSGLTPNSTYHYRIVGSSSSGTTYGQDATFTTTTASCGSTAIVVGQTLSGTLASSDCRSAPRGTSYYSDRYTFSGTAGQQVSVELTSSVFDTYLYLLNSSGNIVAADDDGGTGSSSRIPAESGRITLPASGTYTIDVTSFSASTTGAYTVTLGGPSPPVATTTSARDVTTNSATLRGTVNPSGFATNAYFQWGLTTSYGNTTSSQSVGSGTSDSNRTAKLSNLTPDTTYHYRVVAVSSSGTTYGTDGTFKTGRCGTYATSIAFGRSLNGSLTSADCRSTLRGSSYYMDRFKFTGAAGQQVAISLSSTAFDTFLYLVGPTGTTLTTDNNGGGGTNSRIPAGSGYFTLPAAGTYRIEVTSSSTNATGNFTVSLATP